MIRRLSWLALFLAATPAPAQVSIIQTHQPGAPQPPPVKPTQLTIHSAEAPSPALKYQFLPGLQDQTPGNAALFYDRAITLETQSRRTPEFYTEKLERWLQMPLKDLPREEIRKALEG